MTEHRVPAGGSVFDPFLLVRAPVGIGAMFGRVVGCENGCKGANPDPFGHRTCSAFGLGAGPSYTFSYHPFFMTLG